jgi:hypothetical protein
MTHKKYPAVPSIPVISRYSRAQAIADGELVDVTETAREAGFRYPVAVTRALWERYIVPSAALQEQGQSASGRLWDVLNVLYFAIRRSTDAHDRLSFTVSFHMPQGTIHGVKSNCA